MCCFLELFSSPSQNSNFVDKIRHLRVVDDDYIDKHFGTDSAQYQRETAFELMNGGNIGLSTVMIRNVQSKLKPGKKLIAIKFKCLSKERKIVHTVYMVFEDEGTKEYIPSPASYCTCENGAFFCSHMLCFLYIMSNIQVPWKSYSQEEIKEFNPDSRLLLQSKPCLIELILAKHHLQRQKSQLKRQSKRMCAHESISNSR